MQSGIGRERGFGNEVRLSEGLTAVLVIVAVVLFAVGMVLAIRDMAKGYREWRKEHPKLYWPPDDGGESYSDEEWAEIMRQRDEDEDEQTGEDEAEEDDDGESGQ